MKVFSIVAAIFGFGFNLLMIGVCIVSIVATMRVYSDMGESGWKAIVPIYGTYVLAGLVTPYPWIGLLILVPGVGQFVSMFLFFCLGKAYGKSVAYSICLGIFFPVMIIHLAFKGMGVYSGPVDLSDIGSLFKDEPVGSGGELE